MSRNDGAEGAVKPGPDFSGRPFLEMMFPAALDESERVLRLGQAGKHAGKHMNELPADEHFGKSDGHVARAGPALTNIDEETDAYHILLAGIRLFAVAEKLLQEKKNNGPIR